MSNRRPHIYIVNDAGHNFTLAIDIIPTGKFVKMTKGKVNVTQADRMAYFMAEHIALSEDTDFLLLSGSPVLNALAAALWMVRHKKMTLLIFDGKGQKYIQNVIYRDNLANILDEFIMGEPA